MGTGGEFGENFLLVKVTGCTVLIQGGMSHMVEVNIPHLSSGCTYMYL